MIAGKPPPPREDLRRPNTGGRMKPMTEKQRYLVERCGAALIVVGAAMVYPALALVLAGVMLVLAANFTEGDEGDGE